MATILQGITEMVPMAKFYLSFAAPFCGTIAVTYSGVFATVAVRRCRRLLSRHCSFHFPLVQFTSCRWSDFWRLYLRRQSCRRMLTQKGAKMWRSRRNGSGILHEAASRAGDSHRSFSFVSPNPRPHSEVGVCMDAKHSGLFRPAPQFIIRRCRCEGATPSSPLAVCMHKPAAEPINQSSIHPSIHLPVGRPRSSSFLSPRPTVNVVIMFWRPRNHYFPFRLAATVARPVGRPARILREAGAPAFPGFLWPPGGEVGRGRRDVRSAHPALALSAAA